MTENEFDYGSDSPSQFWEQLREDLSNDNFWADRIKNLKGEPKKRLQLAIRNLPLPAAFCEAAVALRSLIWEKKKAKEDFKDELSYLYWLAAIESFSVPYSTYLRQPGFNVMESIPADVIKKLNISYYELGYEKLGILKKTDIKWCIERWGEPRVHTTLNEIHKELWNKYEIELEAKQKSNLASLFTS